MQDKSAIDSDSSAIDDKNTNRDIKINSTTNEGYEITKGYLKSRSTIEDIEHYINDKYEQNLLSNLKDDIIKDIKIFMKTDSPSYEGNDVISILKEHNKSLNNSITFLREELLRKDIIINSLLTKVNTIKDHHCSNNNNNNKNIPINPFVGQTNKTTIEKNQHDDIIISTNNNEKDDAVNNDNVTKRKKKTQKPNRVSDHYKENNQNSSLHQESELDQTRSNRKQSKIPKKKMLILGDSIIKKVDGWRLCKRMKSLVAVRSISGASSKGMAHHVKGCIEDDNPDSLILHHGTNDLVENADPEVIAKNIVNLAVSAKNDVKEIFVSALTVRNDDLNNLRLKVNASLKRNCERNDLCFIDNDNVSRKMLNSSGLHLNEYGTTRLVNNFCYHVNK